MTGPQPADILAEIEQSVPARTVPGVDTPPRMLLGRLFSDADAHRPGWG